MTSNHHAPYDLGYTCYNGQNKGSETARLSQSTNLFSVRIAVCNSTA